MPLLNHSGATVDIGGTRFLSPTLLLDQNGDPLSLGGSGGTSSTDDAAFTVAASSLTPVGGIVTADSVDSGDVGAFAMLANRQQKVTLYDSSGNELSVGGGTQVTEDAASAANPVGTMLMLRRRDTLTASEVSADSDNIAANATSKGELYVKHTDPIPVTGTFWQATQPVSGTVAATQSGTWTVQPGNTANTTAWKVDGSAVTQPVSAASLPLPSGAATSAKQPALGTAGSASTDVLSVQGIASMTALKVDGSAVTQPVSGTVSVNTHDVGNITTSVTPGTSAAHLGKAEDAAHGSGDTGVMALAVRRDANTSLVDATGDYAPLQVDSAGSLKVAITSGAGSGGTSIADDAAFAVASSSITPVGGTYRSTLDAVDDGDAGAFAMTQNRAQHVYLVDASGNAISVGGGTQYTEDAAAAADPTGTVPMLVRKDTPSATVSADGDNIAQRGTNYGAAYVTLLDTSGNAVSVGGGTQYTEDAAAAADPVVTMQGARRKDTLSTTEVSADGDVIALNATNKGQLHVKLADTVTVDGSGVTQPVSGTFWQATQPVSLAAGATNIAKAEDVASADADVGVPAMAVRKATPANTSGTDGDYEMLQMSAGRLWASATIDAALPAGTNAIGKLAANSGVTIGAVEIAASQTLATVTNLSQLGGNAIAMNTGTRSAGTQRVTIATDDVVPASQSGTWTVQPGNTANTTPWLVSQQPATSGGCSIDRLVSAASTNGSNVKGSAGQVFGIVAINTTGTLYYYKLYNKATSPTVGTDTPVMTIPIPANTAGAGLVFGLDSGVAFGTGIGRALTGAAADNDTTSAATGVLVHLLYK